MKTGYVIVEHTHYADYKRSESSADVVGPVFKTEIEAVRKACKLNHSCVLDILDSWADENYLELPETILLDLKEKNIISTLASSIQEADGDSFHALKVKPTKEDGIGPMETLYYWQDYSYKLFTDTITEEELNDLYNYQQEMLTEREPGDCSIMPSFTTYTVSEIEYPIV